MNIERQGYLTVKSLTIFAHWLTHGQWQAEPSQTANPWSAEIGQIEKTLAKRLSQSGHSIQQAKLPKPVTEHQKVIDLAG